MTLSNKCRRNLACIAVIATALATGAWYSLRDAEGVVDTSSVTGLVAYRMGRFRYEYHAPSGTESLFDLEADQRYVVNVLRDHRSVAAECRRRLEKHLGVYDLEMLRKEHVEMIRRLEVLGYL